MLFYQITNSIFHRTVTKKKKKKKLICTETQKTQIAKAILKTTEREESHSLTYYTTKLQPSKQYGIGTKTEIQIKGTGKKVQK